MARTEPTPLLEGSRFLRSSRRATSLQLHCKRDPPAPSFAPSEDAAPSSRGLMPDGTRGSGG